VKDVKLVVLGVFFLFFAAGTVWAEGEQIPFRFSIGAGAEVNKNTVTDIAIGGVLTNDFAINSRFSTATKLAFSYNLEAVGTMEAEFGVRFYFLSWNSSGPFVQGHGGASFIFWRNDIHDEMFIEPIYGGTLGWRFHFGSVYVEPYGRGGYPFLWGGGLIVGISI
jgi:hypothetical protein